ncbi:DUF3110 domain-containing protein [Lyngbya aestuarii]|uniref:DUF3110 domain-containing protein n=1 Tax=Lyngbya aestuarii TaxID=118322 RepID=UPI00403E2C2F
MDVPKRVFVLLFNARTENEGIYTMRIGDRNKVLMFSSEDDAARFSLMLEAQDFPTATVEEIEAEEIEAFCDSAGYDLELITPEMLAIPPQANVEETDWQADAPETQETEISELDRIRRQLEGLL